MTSRTQFRRGERGELESFRSGTQGRKQRLLLKRVPDFVDAEGEIGWLEQQSGVLAPAPMISADDPPRDRFSIKQHTPKHLSISSEQFFLR